MLTCVEVCDYDTMLTPGSVRWVIIHYSEPPEDPRVFREGGQTRAFQERKTILGTFSLGEELHTEDRAVFPP